MCFDCSFFGVDWASITQARKARFVWHGLSSVHTISSEWQIKYSLAVHSCGQAAHLFFDFTKQHGPIGFES